MTSEEFKAIRLEMGLSQAQLGKKMGMMKQDATGSCPSIHRIETNRMPTAIHAASILNLLELHRLKKIISSESAGWDR